MRTTRLRHALAVVTASAVLAAMSAAAFAAPASAAKPMCDGKVATIVGTAKGEIIRGTARADVIVARGGHDKIYARGGNDTICAGLGNDLVMAGPGIDRVFGQAGRDKLYGGPGPDYIEGQLDDDTLVGGIGYDTCLQGPGTGPWITCELPVPEPPTLVIAYSDVNTNHVYDTGDVMISKIVDTNKDNKVSAGDTILMGQYPTSPNVIRPAQLRSQFEDWKVKTHSDLVASADLDALADVVTVRNSSGSYFYWYRLSATQDDAYWEENSTATYTSQVWDDKDAGADDWVYTQLASPSQPNSAIYVVTDGLGDDGFIDVDFASGV
jgi:hypothetical protein